MEDTPTPLIKKEEEIKKSFKDPYIITFFAILILGIIIRIYYFSITKNQPLWWDESDYMAYAKNLAGIGSQWIIAPSHESLFTFLAAFLFKLNFSEVIMRFFLDIIPSILLIVITYFLAKELYDDKRIALITSFLMATFWEIIFWSMRFHLEAPGLLLGLLSLYVVIKGYDKKEKIFGKIHPNWSIPLAALLVALTYGMRRGYFVFGLFILLYVLTTRPIKEVIKDKYNWIALVIGGSIVFLLEKFVFIANILEAAAIFGSTSKVPFNLVHLQVFKLYFENTLAPFWSILLYLFWIGFIICVANVALHLGYLKKTRNRIVNSDLLSFILIIITLSYFLFYQRSDHMGEPRWYYPLLFGAFICISRSSVFIYDILKKYQKLFAALVIILLLAYGGYYELKHADFIIKNKVGSYSGIKEASLFVKEISNQDDLVIAVPVPQASYYTERNVTGPPPTPPNATNEEAFNNFLDYLKSERKAKFLIITLSEPHPLWMVRVSNVIDANGQARIGLLEIPIMNTTIDFVNSKEDVKQVINYENITFKLLGVKQDAFMYEIIRS